MKPRRFGGALFVLKKKLDIKLLNNSAFYKYIE